MKNNLNSHWLFHVNTSKGICCCVWSLPSLDQSRSGQGYGQSKLLSKHTNDVCICSSHYVMGMYNILHDKFIFNHCTFICKQFSLTLLYIGQCAVPVVICCCCFCGICGLAMVGLDSQYTSIPWKIESFNKYIEEDYPTWMWIMMLNEIQYLTQLLCYCWLMFDPI